MPSDLSGTWSLARNDLVLRAEGCPPNHFGVFLYGPNPIQVPFGNGYLCVGGGISRLAPPKWTGALGIATYEVNYTVPPMSGGPNHVVGGSTFRFQFWYRDFPAGGAFFNISDGLAITFSL